MSKKILVLATSFLDKLITHPKEEGKAKKMLDDLERKSGGNIKIVYRCDRNSVQPLKIKEFDEVIAVIADLEKYDRTFLSKAGVKSGGPLALISRYGIGVSSVDLDSATEFGVMVTNAPGSNALPTAEWTHSTILDVAGRRVLHYKTASAGKTKRAPLDLTFLTKL